MQYDLIAPLLAAAAVLPVEVPRWLQVMIWIAGIAVTLASAVLNVVKGGFDPESNKLRRVRYLLYAAFEVVLVVWAMLQIPAMVRGTWHAPVWFRLWNQTSDVVHIAVYHVVLVILVAAGLTVGLVSGVVIGVKERDWDTLRTVLSFAVPFIVVGVALQWLVGFFDPLLGIIGSLR